ncbi:hypothetical protein J437_LFUL015107 [Ladona fulva]|uniref:Lipase domain-containing protein n=1 Tax=Ladona fulva TaxID=123851 RepID=A0A8K0K2K7_LADFU|nr:hypothetical protein J437_LFUL015107 [Ladona fulva]
MKWSQNGWWLYERASLNIEVTSHFHKSSTYYYDFYIPLPIMQISYELIRFSSGKAARKAGRWNVFLLDWHKLSAGPWYPWAVENVQAVGRHLAKFLDSLANAFEKSSKRHGASFFKNLHVVGYSLGAHVAGVAGSHVTKGRIGRLTGLDPAYPLIDISDSYAECLDASDADFVDVIHTCGGYMGMAGELGHVDFYPNGGTIAQPGCEDIFFQSQIISFLITVGCSHRKSWQYFMESIKDPGGFVAVQCSSWEEFERGECIKDRASIANMGIGANPK